MERDDFAAVGTFYLAATLEHGAVVSLGDAAAHHARVKRLAAGEHVRITDGRGSVAMGTIAALDRRDVTVSIQDVVSVPRPWPIHLRVPIGDKERMLWLAEKATELGIATWQPVRFRRSASVSPRGEGDVFAEKVRARMSSALEQSGGAWLPEILPETSIDRLSTHSREVAVLLDVRGVPLAPLLASSERREPVLLFGPEGGLEAAERESLVSGGWQSASIAATTLRFETAGIAAVALCRAAFHATEL